MMRASVGSDRGLREAILDRIGAGKGQPVLLDQIARSLGIPWEDLPALRRTLLDLCTEGRLAAAGTGRWVRAGEARGAIGTFTLTSRGHGFVRPDPPASGPDFFVPEDATRGAMPGDRVRVVLLPPRRRERDRRAGGRRGRASPPARPAAVVVEVIARARESLVGTVRRVGGQDVLDAPGMPHGQEPFFTREGHGDRAAPGAPEPRAGQRVVARIVEGPAEGRPARVAVERVIGAETDPATDAETVLEEFRIRRDTPPEALAEAARARAPEPGAPTEPGRRDCRDLLVCTIDPADAKDFDDAVSLERREGGWLLGVHIADVAREVRPGSALDREAKLRGNTVYLMDRVVHMLPPELAAGVCSLKPREDRNTFTAFLDLDERGRTVGARIEKTLIRSARRFTYEEVQEVLDGAGGAEPPLAATLREMGALSARMRERRLAEGALDLDLPEVVVDLGPGGAPTGVRVKRRLAAHQLVEEFMLAANRAVAREMLRRRAPYLARVHADPDEDSLERLSELCGVMRYRMEPPYDRRALQRVIEQAQAPERRKTNGDVMLSACLRSLKKAEYAPREEGHYALGWEHYTHFTSPIRRYADTRVHQLLTASLDGSLDEPGARDRLAGDLAEACGLASEREVRAEEAERELTKVKVLRLLAGKLGTVYPGTVVALAEYGIFIEVKGYFVEGLVRIEDLGDDRWKFSSNGFALYGERTRRKFQIGDQVRVRIEAVDLTRRHLDLAVVGRGAPE